MIYVKVVACRAMEKAQARLVILFRTRLAESFVSTAIEHGTL